MGVVSEKNGDVRIVSVMGQINSGNAAEVQAQLLAQLSPEDAACVLDLNGVDYISSAGLRVVLMLAKHQKQKSSPLVLCRLQPNVHEVFDVSGFLAILTVTPDRASALAHLGSHGS